MKKAIALLVAALIAVPLAIAEPPDRSLSLSGLQIVLTPGSLVKVDASVEDPYYGWGSVEAGDVGPVKGFDDKGRIIIDFPNQNGWIADATEMVPVIGRDYVVVRGPDWGKGGPNLSGEGRGTVLTDRSSSGYVRVRWSSGDETDCRFDALGAYDVRAVELPSTAAPAPVATKGTRHEKFGNWVIYQDADAIYVAADAGDIGSGNTTFRFPLTSNGWYWLSNRKGKFVVWSQGTSDPQEFSVNVPSSAPSAASRKEGFAAGNWRLAFSGNKLTVSHKDTKSQVIITEGSNGWWEIKVGDKMRTIYSSDNP